MFIIAAYNLLLFSDRFSGISSIRGMFERNTVINKEQTSELLRTV